MSNREFIEVKREISFGDKSFYTNHYVINKGFYVKASFMQKYPFFDYNNNEYFGYLTKSILEFDTKVMYCGEVYTIIDVAPECSSKLYNGNMLYQIAKSRTPKKGDIKIVNEKNFTLCATYYFINSEGAICNAVMGAKIGADSFRKQAGNMFNTIDDARAALNEIKKQCK